MTSFGSHRRNTDRSLTVSVSSCRNGLGETIVCTGWQCTRELPGREGGGRGMFKTVVLVWTCLNNTAPVYLSELCVPVTSASGRQHLRSTSTSLLQVLRARTMIGRRSFTVAGPSLWNSLLAALRRPEMTLHTFKRQLKAYLFHI